MPSPLILAIETSNPSAAVSKPGAGVALGEVRTDGGVRPIAVEWLRESARHDDDLMPAIDRLVRGAGRGPRDIARIAVSVGPGGYTGLRIAVATGNLMGLALGAQTVAVPSATVVARRVVATDQPFAIALASKDTTTCVTRFDASGHAIEPMNQVMSESGLESLCVARLIADRFLPPLIRDRALALGMVIEPPEFDPVACLEVSIAIAPGVLTPIYAREPDAATLWRQRHK